MCSYSHLLALKQNIRGPVHSVLCETELIHSYSSFVIPFSVVFFLHVTLRAEQISCLRNHNLNLLLDAIWAMLIRPEFYRNFKMSVCNETKDICLKTITVIYWILNVKKMYEINEHGCIHNLPQNLPVVYFHLERVYQCVFFACNWFRQKNKNN